MPMPDKHPDTLVREHIDQQRARIAELEERVAALEAMCRSAGYSDTQIAAGTPYVEMMGS